MKNNENQIIGPVSWRKLQKLIKRHGLQTYAFDTSMLSLDWEGLQYAFQMRDGKIFLEYITIQMDIVLGEVENYENEIFDQWKNRRVW